MLSQNFKNKDLML